MNRRVLLSSAVFLSLSCAGGTAENLSDSLASPTRPGFVDASGNRWLWHSTASFAPDVDDLKRPVPQPAFDRDAPPRTDRVNVPMMLKDGNVYTLDPRDYHPVGPEVSFRMPATLPSTLAVETQAPEPTHTGIRPRYSVPDYREAIGNTYYWPYPATGVLEVSAGSCSATFIGPNTAVTAAHCLYSHPGHQFYSFKSFAPGANAGQSDVFPFGLQQCITSSAFPSNYYYHGGSRDDYGVVTFDTCPDQMGYRTGSMGWWINPTDSALRNNLSIYGYPGSCAAGITWPQPCGNYGTGRYYTTYYGTVLPEYIISDNIYTSEGQSGTGYYTWADGAYWVVGVHQSSSTAHTLDGPFWSVVQAVSAEY